MDDNRIDNKKVYQLLFVLILLLYYGLASYAFLSFQEKDIFFLKPQVDEQTNLDSARAIARGEFSTKLLWQEPGTFFYWALLILAGWGTPQTIKFFQVFFLNPALLLILYFTAKMISRGNNKYALLVAAFYAFCPMPLFFSLTLMTALFTAFLYLVCFFFYFQFYQKTNHLLYGILFVLAWFYSWWTRQHILLFMPILFFFLAREQNQPCEAKERFRVQRNILFPFLLTMVFIIASFSLVSWAMKSRRMTLTTNGPINFYIANNDHYEETVNIWPGPWWQRVAYEINNDLLDPYHMVKEKPLAWIVLLAKKSIWEFTPFSDFRQFHWGYYEQIFPYFKIQLLFNLLLLPFALSLLFFWPRLSNPYKILLLCWWVYHAVNILFMPGIERYTFVVLPVTLLLAVEGMRLVQQKKKLLFLLPLFILALLNIHNPNDFKAEYWEYLKTMQKVNEGKKVQIEIPENTKHLIEWKHLQAMYEYKVTGNFRKVIAIIQSVQDFAQKSLLFSQLLDFSFMQLDLYHDALLVHNWIQTKEDTLMRVKQIQNSILHKTEKMLESYQRENLLTPQKARDIASYLMTYINFMTSTPNEKLQARLQQLRAIVQNLIHAFKE